MPDKKQKAFLAAASKTYYANLKDPDNAGTRYLVQRGITGATAQRFRLGIVSTPVVGHEIYTGRLSIPYLTPLGETVGIKFRRIDLDESSPGTGQKYLNTEGSSTRIFNPAALGMPGNILCICEGELDAITATQEGLAVIGIAGVDNWKPDVMAPPLRGYEVVYVLADNDDKGQGIGMAEKISATVKNVRIVPMPEGYDVNKWVLENPGKLKERLGL